MATFAYRRTGTRGKLTFGFRGRPAMIVLAVIVAAPFANVFISRSTLPDGGVEAVREGISLQYRLDRLAGVDIEKLTYEEGKALERDLQHLENVELRSVSSKGWLWSRIVRAEVSVDGGPPPDGRNVRYLFLRCGPVIDCVVLDDVSWVRYALGLWFVDPPAAAFPNLVG